MNYDQYEALVDELELLRDIDEGLDQYYKGIYIGHEDAKKELLSRIPYSPEF